MISKKRLILISVLTILLVVGGLYATYAINVFEEEVTPTEYDMAFNFDLSGSVTREMTVEAGKTKVFDLDITNPYSDAIQYGVAYSLVSPTSLPEGATIAESSLSKNSAVGMIDANETLSISIVVVNETSSSLTLSFSVINGYKNGGDLIVPTGETLVEGSYQIGPITSIQVLKKLDLISLLKNDKPDFSQVAVTDEGIYATEDDLGISYYFRGASTKNYVKFGKWAVASPDLYYGYDVNGDFAEFYSLEECQNSSYYNQNCTRVSRSGKNMYWRIIRINGDGSIRMIYDGTSAHSNGEKSSDRQVGLSKFNSNNNSNGYVGYMYGSTFGSTYMLEHASDNNSDIKLYLESWWYPNTIKGTDYEQYITDAIYCNDRGISSGTGIGTTITYYAPYQRLADGAPLPKLLCENKNDRFTYNASVGGVEGNDKLEAPVGLITADEVSLAGGVFLSGNNMNYYLYNGFPYLTMSPFYFGSDGYVENFGVNSVGYLFLHSVNYSYPVRPVISIKPETIKYGDGTMGNPFRLEEEI